MPRVLGLYLRGLQRLSRSPRFNSPDYLERAVEAAKAAPDDPVAVEILELAAALRKRALEAW